MREETGPFIIFLRNYFNYTLKIMKKYYGQKGNKDGLLIGWLNKEQGYGNKLKLRQLQSD